MKITGSCHCGALSYEAEVDPERASICHCTDCQEMSGTAFRVTIPAPAETFRMKGEPKIYNKVAESGRPRVQAFCGECGSHIYSAAPGNTPAYSLRLGTCDQRAQLAPKRQIWCRSALPWTQQLNVGPKFETQPPA